MVGMSEHDVKRGWGQSGLRWVGFVLGLLVPWVNDITLESPGRVGSTLGGYRMQAAVINTSIDVPDSTWLHTHSTCIRQLRRFLQQ